MQLEWRWWGPFAISARHGFATGASTSRWLSAIYDVELSHPYMTWDYLTAESACLNTLVPVCYAMRIVLSAREGCGTMGAGASPAASASNPFVR